MIFYFIILGVGAVFIAKNSVTFHQHELLGDAILAYGLEQIRKHDYNFAVDWDDLEDYDKTLLRLWDWGYTRILPPEKFEIIKPYISKVKEMRRNKKNG